MTSILIPGMLLVLALVVVSFINKAQERKRQTRARLRHLRLQVNNLEEIISSLEQTISNRQIIKNVNDEALEILQKMLVLEGGSSEILEMNLRNVQARGEDLSNARNRSAASFQKGSDVQIAQTQLHIKEAGSVLRLRFNRGNIPQEELEIYTAELDWAHLMVSVTSLIAQGHKATARGDLFTAHAFYQKAQHLLMESINPDAKRMRMIKEIGEILSGSRQVLSQDLMPTERIN